MLVHNSSIVCVTSGIVVQDTAAADATGLAAAVTVNSGPYAGTWNFDADADGVDKGDFVSTIGGFTQRSILVTIDNLPINVWFRPDRNSSRVEVIIELCRVRGTLNANAANILSWTWTITQNGSTLVTQNLPQLMFYTRYRWTSAARPIVQTPAQLLTNNLVPKFDATVATSLGAVDCGNSGGTKAFSTYIAPGYGAGLAQAMGGVGGRPDLGVMTVWQANWLANGNANAEATVLTHGEVSAGVPWIQRDENTWAPIDFTNAGNSTMGWGNGTPVVKANGGTFQAWGSFGTSIATLAAAMDASQTTATVDAPISGMGSSGTVLIGDEIMVVSAGGTGTSWTVTRAQQGTTAITHNVGEICTLITNWVPEFSHDPALEYLPYVMTGDPYYLENLQFHANMSILENTFHRANGFPIMTADPASVSFAGYPSMPICNEERALAWSIRNMAMCYAATPDSAPTWLLPKSYWAEVNTNLADFIDNWQTQTTYQIINTGSFGWTAPSGISDSWMVNFQLLALHFATQCAGLGSTWTSFREYKKNLTFALTNGTSGWDNRWPGPFELFYAPVSSDRVPTPTTMTTWADLWTNFLNRFDQTDSWGLQAVGSSDPLFNDYQASHTYACNCWFFELFPLTTPQSLTAGDIATVTFTNASLPSGAVTVNYTITTGDVSSGFSENSTAALNNLISAINTNTDLQSAGITASTSAPSASFWTSGNSAGYRRTRVGTRAFITYQESVIGPVVVSVSAGASTTMGIRAFANGDSVNNPNETDAACFDRPRSYACRQGGTSGTSSAPTGTGTAITDGTCIWDFAPEYKHDTFYPVLVPANFAAFPNWAQDNDADFLMETFASLSALTREGITGASTCQALMAQVVNQYKTVQSPTFAAQWNVCLATS